MTNIDADGLADGLLAASDWARVGIATSTEIIGGAPTRYLALTIARLLESTNKRAPMPTSWRRCCDVQHIGAEAEFSVEPAQSASSSVSENSSRFI